MTIRRVIDSNDAMMENIVGIYETSIVATERKPVDWIRQASTRADFALFVAEVAEAVAGFSTVFKPCDSAGLLEYLAVAEAFRGHGIGAHLFRRAVAHVSPHPLLIEVDAPIGAANDPSHRRARFYSGLKCRRIDDVDYLLPLPARPPPMQLWVCPGHAPTPVAELSRWIDVVYQRVYQQPAGDPRIDQMLATDFPATKSRAEKV